MTGSQYEKHKEKMAADPEYAAKHTEDFNAYRRDRYATNGEFKQKALDNAKAQRERRKKSYALLRDTASTCGWALKLNITKRQAVLTKGDRTISVDMPGGEVAFRRKMLAVVDDILREASDAV